MRAGAILRENALLKAIKVEEGRGFQAIAFDFGAIEGAACLQLDECQEKSDRPSRCDRLIKLKTDEIT